MSEVQFRLCFKSSMPIIVPRKEFLWAAKKFGMSMSALQAILEAEQLQPTTGQPLQVNAVIKNVTLEEYMNYAYKQRKAPREALHSEASVQASLETSRPFRIHYINRAAKPQTLEEIRDDNQS